jgi:hypothetical protein
MRGRLSVVQRHDDQAGDTDLESSCSRGLKTGVISLTKTGFSWGNDGNQSSRLLE